MTWCYLFAGAMIILYGFYAFLDVHYFLRMCLSVFIARYFKKKTNVLDKTEVTGICLTNDVDCLLYHMNNARYLRELDFARADFYERTNLYKEILSNGGGVVQGATTIRYRRFIKTFSRYYITSKIVYWDDQSIYMEHQFISASDAFIHCIAFCKQRITSCSVEQVMSSILNKNSCKNNNIINSPKTMENGDLTKIKPELPSEVAKWIEFNNISSANLRGGGY